MISAARNSAMFLKLLLSVGLIFSVGATIDTRMLQENCSTHYVYHHYLPFVINPILYNITLKIKTNTTFDGVCSVSFDLLHKVNTIILHVHEQQINEQEILLFSHEYVKTVKPLNYNYCREAQTLALFFPNELTPGKYTLLRLEFQGYLNGSQGLVAVEREDNKGRSKYTYVTLFESFGARRAFPCWDLPSMRAQFKIGVVHSNKYRATSITSIEKQAAVGSKDMLTVFELTPKMPTYRLIIALTDDVRVPITSDHLMMLSRSKISDRMQYALEISTQVLHLFAQAGYENLLTTVIAYPNLPIKAMGSGSLAMYREADLAYNKVSDFSGREFEIRKTISQEFTHLWLENFASQPQFNHLWFNRALALFMGYYTAQKSKQQEHMRAMELFLVQVLQPALHNDVVLRVPPVASEYDPFYFTYICKKAAAIIRMLHHVKGSQTFLDGVFLYVNKSQHNVPTPDDFWKLFHNLPGEKQDVNDRFEVIIGKWLKQQYYPRVYVDRPKGSKTIYFKQDPFVKSRNDDKRVVWTIPLSLAWESSNFSIKSIPVSWLKSYKTVHFSEIPLNEWFIASTFHMGFYRVNYNLLTWRKLASYLTTTNYRKIHAVNRAQLIDDAYHLALEKQLDSSVFFDIIEYLRNEIDYIPWHTMFNLLHYMSPYFELPESQAVKVNLLELLNGLLNNIGYEEYDSDSAMTRTLRLLAMKWACKFDHEECLEMANAKLVAHLEDPEENPILPWWENWTYCTGLRKANFNTWHIVLDKFLKTNDTRFLEYLTCVDNFSLLKKLFYKDPRSNGVHLWNMINSIHHVQTYNSIVKKHARNEQVLHMILHRFKWTHYGHSNQYERIIHLIMSVYDKMQLDKVLEEAKHSFSDKLNMIHQISLLRWSQLDRYSSTFPKN